MTASELQQIIDRLNIDQAELARRLGLGKPVVTDYLTGARPVPEPVADAARALVGSGERD